MWSRVAAYLSWKSLSANLLRLVTGLSPRMKVLIYFFEEINSSLVFFLGDTFTSFADCHINSLGYFGAVFNRLFSQEDAVLGA